MEGITKEPIIKMFYMAPWGEVTGTTFRNKGMDVRIPFKVTAKGVKNADESRSEVFRFIYVLEHTENTIPDRMKETAEEISIF